MWEKLGGLAIIIVAFVSLYIISTLNLYILIKIIFAFCGTIIALIGIVILFAEGSILEEHRGRNASKVK
jgi:hypothetical protein